MLFAYVLATEVLPKVDEEQLATDWLSRKDRAKQLVAIAKRFVECG
jgi:hypothetical protein